MHRIAGIVIASSALMRYGRIVVSVRQGADVPYQRERQQEQKPDGNNRCAGPQPNGRPRGARLFLQRPRPADGLQYVHEDLSLVSRGSGRNPPGESQRSAPGLRIVSDELWQAAHARLDASRAVYLRRKQRPAGRQARGGPGVEVPALRLPTVGSLWRQHDRHQAHRPARQAAARLCLRHSPGAATRLPGAQRVSGRGLNLSLMLRAHLTRKAGAKHRGKMVPISA